MSTHDQALARLRLESSPRLAHLLSGLRGQDDRWPEAAAMIRQERGAVVDELASRAVKSSPTLVLNEYHTEGGQGRDGNAITACGFVLMLYTVLLIASALVWALWKVL